MKFKKSAVKATAAFVFGLGFTISSASAGSGVIQACLNECDRVYFACLEDGGSFEACNAQFQTCTYTCVGDSWFP